MVSSDQQAHAQQPEFRDPCFAKLDAQIKAQDANRAKPKPTVQKRSSSPAMPRELLKDIVRLGREIRKRHGTLFVANPNMKDRAARLLRSMLPPKPRRRGRPAIDSVTIASRLLRNLRKRYPNEKPAQTWARIYPLAVPHWETLSPADKQSAALQLRNRVRSRRNQRRQAIAAPLY
jgi:hypothetical protein